MEKKIMNKIDETYELLNERIEDINLKFRTLFKELLTPEILNMVCVIRDHNRSNYMYMFDSTKNITIGRQYEGSDKMTCFYTFGLSNRCFIMESLNAKTYNNNYIGYLELMANELGVKENYYVLIINNLKRIIDDITEKYKNISEGQSDRLDSILSRFETNYIPTKHIKVTVEWI